MNNYEEFYQKLKKSLVETTTFPTTYSYKFIVPNKELVLNQLIALFNFQGAVITTKESKTNKYKSFTVHVLSNSADEIVQKYVEASAIDGIISL